MSESESHPPNNQYGDLLRASNGLLAFFRGIKDASIALQSFSGHFDRAREGLKRAVDAIPEEDEDKFLICEMFEIIKSLEEKEILSIIEDIEYAYTIFRQMTNMMSSDKYKALENVNTLVEASAITQSLHNAKEIIKKGYIEKMNKQVDDEKCPF
jgi:hypothetical protein